jgi:5-methylcytosine-specific restriction endonuclease McrA/predicted nucleic acid-binding Zn ribbon protein
LYFDNFNVIWYNGSMIPTNVRDEKGRIKKGAHWAPKRFCLVCHKEGVRAGRKYCSRECMGIARKGKETWMKGKKHSTITKEKMSKSHKGKRPNNYGKKMPKYSGKNHWNWQGGITKLNWQIRESLEYKNWRRKVFERDNWTCQKCGKRGKGDLHVHHIKDFSKILKKYHITTLQEALLCKELWNPDNGKTLCVLCHKKTDTYANNLRYATVRPYRK